MSAILPGLSLELSHTARISKYPSIHRWTRNRVLRTAKVDGRLENVAPRGATTWLARAGLGYRPSHSVKAPTDVEASSEISDRLKPENLTRLETSAQGIAKLTHGKPCQHRERAETGRAIASSDLSSRSFERRSEQNQVNHRAESDRSSRYTQPLLFDHAPRSQLRAYNPEIRHSPTHRIICHDAVKTPAKGLKRHVRSYHAHALHASDNMDEECDENHLDLRSEKNDLSPLSTESGKFIRTQSWTADAQSLDRLECEENSRRSRPRRRAGRSTFEARERMRNWILSNRHHADPAIDGLQDTESISSQSAIPLTEQEAVAAEDRLRNLLFKYTDPTCSSPPAASLSDLEPDKARLAWLSSAIRDCGGTDGEFVMWVDVASTQSLSDALNRLDEWNRRSSSVTTTAPIGSLPYWLVEVLLKKARSRHDTYQVVRGIHEALLHSNTSSLLARDARRKISTMLRLATEGKMTVVIPSVIRLACDALSCSGVDGSSESVRDLARRCIGMVTKTLRTSSEKNYGPSSFPGTLRSGLMEILITCDSLIDQLSLSLLMHTRVLDLRMREWLLDRQKERLTAEQLLTCFYSASREGSMDHARQFFDQYLAAKSDIDVTERARLMGMLAKTHPEPFPLLSAIEQATREVQPRSTKKDASATRALADLLSTASKNESLDEATFRQLVKDHSLLNELQIAGPYMEGLLSRGHYSEVLKIWHRLGRRDVVALSAAVRAKIWTSGVSSGIRFMDSYASRPKASGNLSEQSNARIRLDTRIINDVLEACNRRDQPTTAYRIWQAMESRWGVLPDSRSLAIMLYIAVRNAPTLTFGQAIFGPSKENDRDPAIPIDAYTKSLYASCPIDLIVSRDDSGSPTRLDWRVGRSLFREIAFSNWPHLALVSNPLSNTPGVAHPPMLPSSSTYCHMHLPDAVFHAFISLLGKRGLVEEIPTAFAWMKSLNVQPRKSTICLSLLYLEDEGEPARLRKISTGHWKWIRKDQALKIWLTDWLGPADVPTEDEVAQFRRRELERGGSPLH